MLPAAITEARASLVPIDAEELAVLLVRSGKVWKLPDDWRETSEFYVEALEDVPRDLVHAALKHCRLTLKWFPKPAELRQPIADELARRRGVLRRLETMQQRVEREGVAGVPPVGFAGQRANRMVPLGDAIRLRLVAASDSASETAQNTSSCGGGGAA